MKRLFIRNKKSKKERENTKLKWSDREIKGDTTYVMVIMISFGKSRDKVTVRKSIKQRRFGLFIQKTQILVGIMLGINSKCQES